MQHLESLYTQFTAKNCEKEPIHIPGAIQQHGILFALRSSDLTILQISANCFDILGIHHDELLHQPLSQIMDIRIVEEALTKLGEKTPRLLNPIPIALNARGRKLEFDGILHRSGRIIILELEKHIPIESGYGGFGGFYEAIREVATRLLSTESLDEVMLIACEEVRKLTGYSRVLAYQFDEDWNGTVVAESKEPQVKSLLHHRFPSTDIPKQARELYTVNWLRIIPDVNYKPSAVVPPLNPITDRPLDMSNAVLRSVSPIHLEYMRNMGQHASMSVSMLNNKKLWGLLSCHNEESRFLKYDVRVACEFIGQMVSAQISARSETTEVNHSAQLKTIFLHCLRAANVNEAYELIRFQPSALMGLADSPGAAIFTGNDCYLIGSTPTEEQTRHLCDFIFSIDKPLFHSNFLSEVYEPAKSFRAKASGVMAISLPNRTQILWFRPELAENIQWSGNPELSRNKDANDILTPRKSFETWIENVEGRAKSWRQPEIDAAHTLLQGLSQIPLNSVGKQNSGTSLFRQALKSSLDASAESNSKRNSDTTVANTAPTSSATSVLASHLIEGFDEFSILFLDQDGRIMSWSAGAKRLLGYAQSEVIGKKLDMFFSEDEVLKDKNRSIVRYAEQNNRYEEEIWLYRSDRSSFWSKLLVSALRDENKTVIGYSVVMQDITKEKSAEEELKATKVAAEAANQAKTAFLGNISHEIRTPLGAVLGFAELLRDKNLSDDDRINLSDRIRRNGSQLTTLINDLLDLTKVEANRLEVEMIEMDLSALLADVAETLNIRASEKSLRFGISIEGKVPRHIVSDPTRLRQILVNIINNAIKFTPQGGTVDVRVSLDTKTSQRKILIRVEDSGRGMTEDQMLKLFQPFAQADISTTRKYGGSGLGLFVSQRLARLLRGDVSIEKSELGKGSTFLISIDPGHPVDERTFDKLGPTKRSIPLNALSNKELEGIKVLIVDDAPDNRHLISLYLARAGAISSLAENGREGIDMALKGDFDAVLMDIQMPVLDGNDAMIELRERNYRQPVIALTAHAMAEERNHSLELGFADYLTKPIARDQLIRTLSELVRPNS